jgi:hypothetical protein
LRPAQARISFRQQEEAAAGGSSSGRKLAGRVALKIICLIARLVTALAVLVFRRDLATEAELLALRHENAVLRRPAGQIRYEPADRVGFTGPATSLIP